MLVLLRCVVIFLSIILGMPAAVSAQPVTQKTNPCCPGIEAAKSKYLTGNQYNEFIDFLGNFKDKSAALCLDYYRADTRYLQLKYLEDQQSWDDYFANGNNYRDQIVQSAQKVIADSKVSNCLRPKTRLLLWQFHHAQQDSFYEQALIDLITDLKAYAQLSPDAALVKDIADSLLSNGEKIKARELYQLYVGKLVEAKMTDPELKTIAAQFYQERNLELAQAVYDIYIEKAQKSLSPDKFVQELFEIASMFNYKPQGNGLASNSQSHKATGLYDMVYAEKIYERIEGLGLKNVFNQEQIYLRAFNLEKMKEYKRAKELYAELIQLDKDTKHFDEVTYKIAMIDAYVFADIQQARNYFEKLAAKLPITSAAISSFYQLGLLAQWEGDLIKAKDYYDALIKNSGDLQTTTVAQAKERLKEIEDNQPLNYNLKTFLDLSFKVDSNSLETGKSELVSDAYKLEKGQKIVVSSLVNLPESGCIQVELQYFWSGDLGQASPSVSDSSLECSYADVGTKEINLVIVSSSGIIDRSFTMVDVY